MKENDMIKLIDILKEITEGKQVGILYHVVNMYGLEHNLENNRFDGTVGTDKTVSFTRCKDYIKYGEYPVLARFVLDGDKMSNNYKFTPIDEFPDRLGDYNNYPDECEEISKTINNINKYIIKIEIFKKILNQIKSDDDDDYKMIINVIKDYLKKFPNIKIEYI
jgi:hypothetical protein